MELELCSLCHDPDTWLHMSCVKVTKGNKRTKTGTLVICYTCGLQIKDTIDQAIRIQDEQTENFHNFFN